jgi:hypothetical protein
MPAQQQRPHLHRQLNDATKQDLQHAIRLHVDALAWGVVSHLSSTLLLLLLWSTLTMVEQLNVLVELVHHRLIIAAQKSSMGRLKTNALQLKHEKKKKKPTSSNKPKKELKINEN